MCSHTIKKGCRWTEESSFSWNSTHYFTSPQCPFSFLGWWYSHRLSPYQSNSFIGPSRSNSTLYLKPKDDLYPIHFRVFDCTCFVHDLIPGKDNLFVKALKCIFLGYSCIQKRYCYFCPKLQWYIVSSDVSFFETSPFFLPLRYLMRMVL